MTIAQDYNFNHCIMKKIIYGLAIAGIAVSMTSCAQKQNTLTSAEKADGWVLLFNGENLDGWRDYNGDSLTNGWKVVDGCIQASGNGADESGYIVTDKKYENFELSWELETHPRRQQRNALPRCRESEIQGALRHRP